MLIELFDKTHHKKYDFLYLPIDPDVIFNLLRILVILDMLLSILWIVSTSKNFINCSMGKNGKGLIVRKFAS